MAPKFALNLFLSQFLNNLRHSCAMPLWITFMMAQCKYKHDKFSMFDYYYHTKQPRDI